MKSFDINKKEIKEAVLAGIDIELLFANLALSPEERLIQHQEALNLLIELEKAGKVFNAKPK